MKKTIITITIIAVIALALLLMIMYRTEKKEDQLYKSSKIYSVCEGDKQCEKEYNDFIRASLEIK